MKKTLLALAVLAAGTANAAEIYSSDNSSVSLKGEIDGYLAQMKEDKADTDPDINVWGKLQLDANQKLSNGLTSFASFKVESGSWYDGTDNNAKFDDMYIGVKGDKWGVALGETGDFADSNNAIEKTDITNGGEDLSTLGGHPRESKGKGVAVKYNPIESLTLVVDADTNADDNIDNTYGVSADYSADMFSVGATYINGETDSGVDYRAAGISGSVEFGGLYAALTYTDYKGVSTFGLYDAGTAYTGDVVGAALQYTIDKVRLYTTYGVSNIDKEIESKTKVDGKVENLVVGVDYALLDNVTVFAEYQDNDASKDFDYKKQTYVAGVYYTF